MRVWAPLALAHLALIPAPAHAEVTPVDLQIAARALGFMERPLSGNVRLGVVYDPAEDGSMANADAVVTSLGARLKAGNLVFEPVAVNIDAALIAPVDVLFLPDGVEDRGMKIARATAQRRLPCITLNVSEVQSGNCVLGIQVDPKVRIYVNRAAAAASDITFVSVFRMMVTEF